MTNSNHIEYHNPERIIPLILDRYIYIVVGKTKLLYRVFDSFYTREDAEVLRKTLEAKEETNNSTYKMDFLIHETRLYK